MTGSIGIGKGLAVYPDWARCSEKHIIDWHSSYYKGFLLHRNNAPDGLPSWVCVTPYGDLAGVPSLLSETKYPDQHAITLEGDNVFTRCAVFNEADYYDDDGNYVAVIDHEEELLERVIAFIDNEWKPWEDALNEYNRVPVLGLPQDWDSTSGPNKLPSL